MRRLKPRISFLYLQLLITSVAVFISEVTASVQITADPNLMGSCAEYSGALKVKAGTMLTVGTFEIGGFIESRNESRFNEGLLPNHNWRGFVAATGYYPVIRKTQAAFLLKAGIEHESSHATMGIAEYTEQPYELIYDNTYRKSALNAALLGGSFETSDARNRILLKSNLCWYFLSKNTPELPGLATAGSAGFSIGGLYRYLFKNKIGCFLSAHERYIFKGAEKVHGEIYLKNIDDILSRQQIEYPIMKNINTFSCCAGISLPLFQSRHLLEIYLRFLNGHCYGYVDSRDKRMIFSAGVALNGL